MLFNLILKPVGNVEWPDFGGGGGGLLLSFFGIHLLLKVPSLL